VDGYLRVRYVLPLDPVRAWCEITADLVSYRL
jgi:phage gp36-like protein